MKLLYYKQKKNVGDILNEWLWPQLLGPNFFNDVDDKVWIGIGSILSKNSDVISSYYNSPNKKIVFGAGVRNINEKFNINESWDIRFVRGPLSSYQVFGNTEHYITDGAYAISLLENYPTLLQSKKEYPIAFVPYFRTEEHFDFEKLGKELNIKIISPRLDPEEFLNELSKAELVIAEAMHGAIIADVLRIPWQRIKCKAHHYENPQTAEFKWLDWLKSMDLDYQSLDLNIPHPDTFGYRSLPAFLQKKIDYAQLKKRLVINKGDFQLSNQSIFDKKSEEISSAIADIKSAY